MPILLGFRELRVKVKTEEINGEAELRLMLYQSNRSDSREKIGCRGFNRKITGNAAMAIAMIEKRAMKRRKRQNRFRV